MARHCLTLLIVILLATVPARAGSFDFAALQNLIRQRNIGSVEELIAALPPLARTRFALMFESRSLQGASFKDPRVILYGSDARFVLTFNGDPGERGYRTIETMEFDAQAKEFRFRELQFPSSAAGAAGVVLSEPNPARCTRCHGNPARPVWDTHPLWPGAYGERYLAGLSPAEAAGLSAFLARQPSNPRYRHLLGVNRFVDPATFRPAAATQYTAAPAESPNAELANHLSRLQFEAIARGLARQPNFSTFQYVLLGAADNTCGAVADFFPAALWRMQERRFEGFARGTSVANSHLARLKAMRVRHARRSRAAGGLPTDSDALTGLRFVVEAALGLSTRDWSLALEQGTYDFTVLPGSGVSLLQALLGEVGPRDAAIRELFPYATSSDGDRYCTYLKRRSRAALLAYVDTTAGPARDGTAADLSLPDKRASKLSLSMDVAAGSAVVPATPAALLLCSQCHETGIAPAVAFSNARQLKRELQEKPAAHGALLDEILFRLSTDAGAQRMPLGTDLSQAQRRALAAYFVALAAED